MARERGHCILVIPINENLLKASRIEMNGMIHITSHYSILLYIYRSIMHQNLYSILKQKLLGALSHWICRVIGETVIYSLFQRTVHEVTEMHIIFCV